MRSRKLALQKGAEHETLKAYLLGLGLSILLTLTAYFVVVKHVFTGWTLVLAIVALAITQALVQLILFLHLGRELQPRWNLIVFLFMVLVIVIVIGGSLWIMYNLNARVMPTMDVDTYMLRQQGI